MDKSKSLKKALISVLIFGVVALLAWGALFVVLGLGVQSKTGGEMPFFKLHFSQLFAVLSFQNNKYYLASAFSILGVLVLAGIFLILLIVLSAVKRRAIMVVPYIVFFIATFGMWEFFANAGRFTVVDPSVASGYLAFIKSSSLSKTILTIALVACLFVAYVLAFIAFILSMVHACKYPGGKAAVSQNELDEVNVDNEPAGKFEEEPEPERPVKDEKQELIDMIKELIRQEVRGGQQSNQTVTGATFAAPLIVQYFNGTNPTGPQQNVVPAPAEPEKKEEPAPEKKPEPKLELVVEPEPYEEPAPVEPEPQPEPEPVVPEPVPEPEPEPQPEPEPAPVVEEPVQPVVVAPALEPEPEKKPIIRIPFEERMISADKEMKDNYNELKNEILSYGVKSRVSNSGDTFRLHRKTYIKLTIAGKSLKLYFALNPDDYKNTTIPVQDASEKGIYEEIPLVFKVKSGLSMKSCTQLIADTMEKDNLVQGEIGKVNWVKEIAASLKEAKKAEKEEKDD